ncbi:MAG: UDP-N-acetylmuramoyl-tripeptide--D-alanyl-D-alanine ligase [Desulfobacterales bacterium]
MKERQPIPWTTEEIIAATGGELLCGDMRRTFARISIDSRDISADDFFFAIIGESHDGHGFAPAVIDQGVGGLVIDRRKAAEFPIAAWQTKNITCIAVSDTTRALGDLAGYSRRRAKISVVAITGSNGKTTTRKLTAGVVARKYKTLATAGNFNNQIGLPLTLLKMTPAHQVAVVELGTNNPGEIARLAEISAPDIGVLTNIGPAHLEGLGSLEGVMREKGDLIKGLGPGGKAVLNADDTRVLQLAREARREVLLYGRSTDATVRADQVKEAEQTTSFRLMLGRESVAVQLKSPGQYMVSNALAAAAVGFLLGIPAAAIKTGLESFTPVAGRMNICHLPNGIHIIDDTYNANPDSMNAALATLNQMRAASRGIFVSGDMLELGARAPELHRQLGARAASMNIDRLYVSGEHAAAVADGARNEGLQPADAVAGSREHILDDLKKYLQPGDWVLVKGSRGMAMEKIVEGLKLWAQKRSS